MDKTITDNIMPGGRPNQLENLPWRQVQQIGGGRGGGLIIT